MQFVYVYRDQGVGPHSYRATLESLKQLFSSNKVKVESLSAQKLLTQDWEKNCLLFVMPGGRDIPYHEALSGPGCTRIQNYVASGGCYLGICAGAYFGCREIIFEEDGQHQVKGSRELCFFPETAIGVLYHDKPFSYLGHESAHAAQIEFEGDVFEVYYNGGCYFHGAEQHAEHVEVLGRYKNASVDHAPAVVLCDFGKGKALLSGVHVEVSAKYVESLEDLYPVLNQSEAKRKQVFERLICHYLGLARN